ncbi:MAG: hypothetical protein ACKO24_08090 [Leptolyngbyaceae cyanobacterium]
MNRAQIRRAFIEAGHKNTTDAQIRAAIAAVNLPVEDGYDYNPEQLLQIQDQLLKPEQPQPQPTDRGQSQRVEQSASTALSQTAASTLRSQFGEVAKVIETINEQKELASTHLGKRLANAVDPDRFFETVCIKALDELEARQARSPFVLIPSVDLPPISDAERQYQASLQRLQRSALLEPSLEQQPVLVGSPEPQNQPEQSSPESSLKPESSSRSHPTVDLPPAPSNGKSDLRKEASRGFGRTQGK